MKLCVPGAFALALFATGVMADTAPLTADQVHAICAADFQKHCPNLQPGPGPLRACAHSHFMSFTKPCRHALLGFHDRPQPQPPAGSGDASTPATHP